MSASDDGHLILMERDDDEADRTPVFRVADDKRAHRRSASTGRANSGWRHPRRMIQGALTVRCRRARRVAFDVDDNEPSALYTTSLSADGQWVACGGQARCASPH